MADSQEETSTGTMDIEAASSRIGESLFGAPEASETEQPSQELEKAATPPASTQPSDPQQAAPDLLPAPESWKQDMHPYWQKMPREAQQYYNEREEQMLKGMTQYKQIQSVIAPFVPQLSQRGVTPYDWIRGLAQAEVMLTSGTDEQRRAAYHKLGEQLGFAQPAQEPANIDPMLKQLQQRQEAIERGLQAQQEAVYKETRSKVQSEVDAFAGDSAHPYFDEVAADDSPRGLAAYLRQGLSLQDAYDAAVWANPVTRAKEQASALTAHEAKLKENARLSSLPKRRATSVNVRSVDQDRAPTEPSGNMEDTIKTKLREIRSRAS